MTDVPEAVGRRILRLLAVERGLQDEGQGNAARLFRAAALGEALRATRFHPRLGRGLEQAVTDIIDELRAVGSQELAALMAQALATVSVGGWPTLAQIPPTFVCRDCGEVHAWLETRTRDRPWETERRPRSRHSEQYPQTGRTQEVRRLCGTRS